MPIDYDDEQFEEINPELYANDDGESELPPEEEELDELSAQFVEKLINKILEFQEVLVGYPLHPYQMPLARRVIESVLINDGEEITALAARQSGK